MKKAAKTTTTRRQKQYSGPPSEGPGIKKGRVWLNVLPEDLWLRAQRGTSVWAALQHSQVLLEGDCGGLGKCGKCKIRVITPIGPPTREEKELLGEKELAQGVRLACRVPLKRDLVIDLGTPESDIEHYQILKTGQTPVMYLDPPVTSRPVHLPERSLEQGLADLDRIEHALGPEHSGLTATLACLRNLPARLRKLGNSGTAIVHDNRLMDWKAIPTAAPIFGVAFDLGTSTLVGKLINLVDGGEVGVACCLNSQIRYGCDVISRLKYVKENQDGLLRLHQLMMRDVHMLAARLLKAHGLAPDDVYVAVVAGNTTMQHLLLRLDPLGIAEAPFLPVLTDGLVLGAAEAGFRFHGDALLYVMPTKSGYIGGDLISAIMASGASEQDTEMVLGLDLGTNGEIFLGNRRKLMTCSAASGPALEGARISHGMIARAGAIEGVRVEEGRITYRTVGNVKPKGICGSGLVDLAAVLLHCGIIDCEGLILSSPDPSGDPLFSRVVEQDGVQNFLVASGEESYDGKPVYFTQKDVREVQLAKGAIAAGVQTLMHEMRIGPGEIDRICLAGAFGNYVNAYSAVRIGLLPSVSPEIVCSLGNAASTGAVMTLLSRSYWELARRLAETVEHVELSSRFDFNERFIEAMDFPARNIW